MSDQSPYHGQAAWFAGSHHEQLPSATEQYCSEIRRVMKVLDSMIVNREYIVSDECSYTDLAFVPWAIIATSLLDGVEKAEIVSEAPHYSAWLDRLKARSAAAKVLEERIEAMATVPPGKGFAKLLQRG